MSLCCRIGRPIVSTVAATAYSTYAKAGTATPRSHFAKLGRNGSGAVTRMDDDVAIDELREAVEHLHSVSARFLEAVEVDERFNGEVVWQGAVKIFELTGTRRGQRGPTRGRFGVKARAGSSRPCSECLRSTGRGQSRPYGRAFWAGSKPSGTELASRN